MFKTKKFLTVVLAIVMLMQTLIVPGIAADIDGFTDFPANSWSTEAMVAAVDNGLLVGTSETTIEPTTTTEGEETRICSVCEEIEAQSIPVVYGIVKYLV